MHERTIESKTHDSNHFSVQTWPYPFPPQEVQKKNYLHHKYQTSLLACDMDEKNAMLG